MGHGAAFVKYVDNSWLTGMTLRRRGKEEKMAPNGLFLVIACKAMLI
jgi:hypothetical protein